MSTPDSTTGDTPIVRLAQIVAPNLHIVSVSEPEPVMHQHNVIVSVPSTEAARAAVLELESLEKHGNDNSIGLVVMGTGAETQPSAAIDTEGVTRYLAPRVIIGALSGAAVGALLGALLASLFTEDVGVAGAALGGAALFTVIGGFWGAFSRFGGSDAYRQTFVEPHAQALSIVSFHTDHQQLADEAFDRLAAKGHDNVIMLDQSLSNTERTTSGRFF